MRQPVLTDRNAGARKQAAPLFDAARVDYSLRRLVHYTGGDWRKVYSGNSTYKDNFAAGTAFIVIRRSDAKGLANFGLWLALLVTGGCALGPPIDDSYRAASQDSRAQYLIIHFTVGNYESSLKTLTQGAVSSHYLVRDDPPTIYRLVEEDRRAYHAGVSSWKGQTQLNAASIGIEIVNRGNYMTENGLEYADYPPAQLDAVMDLVKWIVRRHEIRPDRILGHSDIAPQRKMDPGPRFPWKRLADEGLIPWPDEATVAAKRSIQPARCSLIFFQSWKTKRFFISAWSLASTLAISPSIFTLVLVGTIR